MRGLEHVSMGEVNGNVLEEISSDLLVELEGLREYVHVLIVAPNATTFQFDPSDTATVAAPEFPSVT